MSGWTVIGNKVERGVEKLYARGGDKNGATP